MYLTHSYIIERDNDRVKKVVLKDSFMCCNPFLRITFCTWTRNKESHCVSTVQY